MVEGADAKVAAQPFGNARPERCGIAAHRLLSRILPIAMSALPHLICPFPRTSWPRGRGRTRSDSSPAAGAGTSSRARSEEHTSELQSLMRLSYAVFRLKKKNNQNNN